jgi:serine/threonine-protein kinase
MKDHNTQIWQQAINIYANLSELSVNQALKHIENLDTLKPEIKQAVITLVNSGNQASQYIKDHYTPNLTLENATYPEIKIGLKLGEYELVEKLGQGGMSRVFKAQRIDSAAQKMVAIKIFTPQNHSHQLLDRFVSEQQILSKFNHKNIVDMLHGGTTENDTAYLVMELIENALPIDKFCAKKKLTIKQKILYIAECAEALSYSHANLIIHRDLKPDNILVNGKKHVKIVDFGIAKLINNDIEGNNTTIMALTPNYAAPEQVNSQPITVKTDIFSLAVVALHLLCDSPPLPTDRLIKSCINDDEFIDRNLKKNNCDKDLKNILRKALEHNPDDRYSSMQSFADDLNNWLDDKPVNATSQSFIYRIKKFAQRRSALFATMTTLFASLLIGFAITLWQFQQIKIEAGKAQHVKQFMLDTFNFTNPNTREGIKISASDLLKVAALKLDENTDLNPAIKFELYQSLAIANSQLGYFKKAIDLLNKSLLIKPNNSKSMAYLAANYFQADDQTALNILLSKTDETLFESDIDQLKFSLVRAQNLSANGDTKQAIALIDHIQSINSVNKIPSEQVHIQQVLAGIYFDKSEYEKTIEILESILSHSSLPPKNTLILSTRLELGRTYNTMGKHDLALDELKEIEKYYKQILGEQHPDLGVLYFRMSSSFKAKGQIKKAHEYAQLSYDFNIKTFGEQGIQLSNSINMLAVLAQTDGNTEKAIELTKKAISILAKTYDPNHPLILELKTNLAFLLGRNKHNEKSLEILRDVYNLQKDTLGINHYSTINTESTIIGTLLNLKMTSEAKELALTHLQKVRKNINKNNIRTVNAYASLARVYLQTNEKQKRLDTFLEIEKQKLLNESDPHYVMILFNIAQAYNKMGDVENAMVYFQNAFKVNAQIYPDTHFSHIEMKLIYAKFLKSHNHLNTVKEILTEVRNTIKKENYKNKKWQKWIKKLEQK